MSGKKAVETAEHKGAARSRRLLSHCRMACCGVTSSILHSSCNGLLLVAYLSGM